MQGEFERNRYKYKRRDYTSGAVRTPAPSSKPAKEPEPEKPEPKIKPARVRKIKIKKNKRKIFLIMIVLVIAVAGFVYYKYESRYRFFPSDIHRQADFSLYYPTQLPAGFNIDKTSIKLNQPGPGQLYVAYYIRFGGKKRLTVSIQKRPKAFDYQSLYNQQFTDTSAFIAADGTGVVGESRFILTTSFVTKKSWLFITAPPGGIDKSQMLLIANSLKKD